MRLFLMACSFGAVFWLIWLLDQKVKYRKLTRLDALRRLGV